MKQCQHIMIYVGINDLSCQKSKYSSTTNLVFGSSYQNLSQKLEAVYLRMVVDCAITLSPWCRTGICFRGNSLSLCCSPLNRLTVFSSKLMAGLDFISIKQALDGWEIRSPNKISGFIIQTNSI